MLYHNIFSNVVSLKQIGTFKTTKDFESVAVHTVYFYSNQDFT